MFFLTSPAVVNCIKAVSGSMATFYNSYFYGEREREKKKVRPRISAGKDERDQTKKQKKKIKNKNTGERGALVFSEMFQYNM